MENCETPAALTAEKTASKTDVVLGDVVDYTITYTAEPGGPIIDASFVDVMPVGITYVADSAEINGVAEEPQISGRTLTWPNQTILGDTVVTLMLQGLVTTQVPAGDMVNQAYVADATGAPLSNTATAVVSRIPEAVFDC